jgi:hypothetical protein
VPGTIALAPRAAPRWPRRASAATLEGVSDTPVELGALIRGHEEELVKRAVEAYRLSPLRLPTPVDGPGMARLLSPILESLGDALGPTRLPTPEITSPLVPGSAAAREVEKSAALVGAILASGTASGFDAAALFYALRDVLVEAPVLRPEDRAALRKFAEWITVVAFDAFAAARVQAERERARDQLEDGTPVVQVTPELPAAFLVGRPDGVLCDSVLSRLLLLVVRVGARAAIVNASGLTDPARREVIEALRRFMSHRKVAGAVHLIAVGLPPEAEEAWTGVASEAGVALSLEPHFDRAVERALALSGYRLVRS